MISRETENVKSSEEIESAFRALSAENKPYVTKEELYQVQNDKPILVTISIGSVPNVWPPFHVWCLKDDLNDLLRVYRT